MKNISKNELLADDFIDFGKAEKKVFEFMKDEKWHSAQSIIDCSGQREGLRRMRQLRQKPEVERIERRKGSGREWEYKLILAREPDVFAGFDEEKLITMDGFDNCIAGVVERFGQEPIVCYDKGLVLSELEAQGMSGPEAEKFFYFNQIGDWVGINTPCFISKST